uniref:GRIP domain-containing protein n=1 Tax=Heterorhabditis bacteriophora TaxID=37862 RepID=A0A1I7XJY4_HETBA
MKQLASFQLTANINNIERRMLELEADNRVLNDRHRDMEELYERDREELRNRTKLTEELREKVLNELQKEVKQLYMELNEKTEALDKMRDYLAEKEMSNCSVAEQMKSSALEESSQKDYMYEEELESMRKKLSDCHREIDGLREINNRLERDLDFQKGQSSYLKNVLYRYMSEREILGKETVTLARVIGTVAKFSNAEMEAVLAREESRVAGWVGGAVSQVSHAFTSHR